MEAELTALHRARLAAAEVAPLRGRRRCSVEAHAAQEEVAGLQAMLRAANASHENDTSIDKRLVASVLVKYFERGRNDDVLAVLGSMLNCRKKNRLCLGLRWPSETAHTDAKFSDMWVDFLLNEAERASSVRPRRRAAAHSRTISFMASVSSYDVSCIVGPLLCLLLVAVAISLGCIPSPSQRLQRESHRMYQCELPYVFARCGSCEFGVSNKFTNHCVVCVCVCTYMPPDQTINNSTFC